MRMLMLPRCCVVGARSMKIYNCWPSDSKTTAELALSQHVETSKEHTRASYEVEYHSQLCTAAANHFL
jgi:hypothetical protein